MTILLYIFIGLAITCVPLTIILYNRLAGMRLKAREAQSGVDIQLEKKTKIGQELAKEASQDTFDSYKDALVAAEKDFEMACRYYNAVVRDYNAALEQFPSTLIAILLNFRKMEFHEGEQNGESPEF
ncbi:MAG: LemA family protein [Bacteroidia bacterium]|nr:LemA family protein [Bacteroidia bacterium]